MLNRGRRPLPGEPDFDWVKLCHCGSSRNPSQAPPPGRIQRNWAGGPTVSEWIVRGIVGDMGIYQQECTGRRRLDMPTFRYPVCWPFAAFPSHQPADAGFLLYAIQPDTQRMYCPVCPSAVTCPATSQVTWSALAHT